METVENNYVAFCSLSTLRLEDILDFAKDKSRSGGGDVFEEHCKINNENEVVVCFKNFQDAVHVLEIKLHDLKLDNGMTFLLHAIKWSPTLVDYGKYPDNSSEEYLKFKPIPVEERDVKQSDEYTTHSKKMSTTVMENLSFIEVFPEKILDLDLRERESDDVIVKVSGLNPEMKDDNIKNYFQRSYGNICFFERKEPVIALIKFSNIDDANFLLRSTNVRLKGAKLDIKVYTGENYDMLWDETKFVISGISATASLRDIYSIVESMTDIKYGFKILKGNKKGICIACHEQRLDFFKIKSCGYTFDKICKTFQIEVSGFCEQTTEDALKTYFQDEKHGGGVIENLEIDPCYRIALITFIDYRVVQNLVQQRRKLHKTILRVFPYYSCIGYQTPLIQFMEYICDIDTDEKILNFIKNSESCLNDLEVLLKQDGSTFDLSRINKIIVKKQCLSKAEANSWRFRIMPKVKMFLSKFINYKLDALDDVLFDVTIKMYNMHSIPKGCLLSIDHENKLIELTGNKDIIKHFLLTVEQTSKRKEKKGIYLASHQIRFLLMSGEIELHQSQEITIIFNDENNCIILKGYLVHVMYFSEKISKLLLSMKTKTVSLPEHYFLLLQNLSYWKFITNVFTKASIIASFEIISNNDLIIASTDDSLELAYDLLSKSIKQISIDLSDEFAYDDLKMHLTELINNICEKHCGLVNITVSLNKLAVTTVSTVFDNVKTEIQEFLEANFTFDDEIDLKSYDNKGKFFIKYYQQEINLEKQLNKVTIDIPGTSKIFLKGPAKKIKTAKSKLIKLMTQIFSTQYIVNQQEILIWLKDEMFQELIKFCEKYPCWIEQTTEESQASEEESQASEEESSFFLRKIPQKIMNYISNFIETKQPERNEILQQSTSNNFEQQFESNSASKQNNDFTFYQMQLKQSDITLEEVDAIVNGLYNGSLNGGEIATVIKRAAGSLIETEFNSKSWTDSIFKVITSVGNLPCKKIICMNLRFNNLSNDILNCLNLAVRENIKSIAIPAFGTGNANQKPEDIASQIFDAVQKFNEPYQNQMIIDIRIVLFNPNVFQTFKTILSQKILQSPTSKFNNIFKINDLFIELKSGDIFKEKADILVNSMSQNMNLIEATGSIAKIIREQGGSEIINECQNLGQVNSDGLAVTTAGKFDYKKIIHFATSDSNNLWEKRVTDCLIMADQLAATSIAFPALGTGAGKLDSKTSAKILYSGIKNFFQSQTLKTIKIILYPKTLLPCFITVFANSFPSDELPLNPYEFNIALDVPCFLPMNFTLYLKDANIADQVKKEITFWLQSKVTTTEMHYDPHIIVEELQEIYNIGKQNNVLIDVDFEKTQIKISGVSNNVIGAVNKIHLRLDNTKTALIKSEIIQWYFRKSSLLNFKKVDKFKNLKLEKMFLDQSSDSIVLDGCNCDITSLCLKRVEININKIPIQWDHMTENELIVELNENSEEYKTVASSFITSVQNNVTIRKIQRIQNKPLYEQYFSQKSKIEKKNGGSANEKRLFHGTLTQNVDNINSLGFNRSLAGYNATQYGFGSYFALSASYSYHYSKVNSVNLQRSMYYCRVLVGKYTLGNSSMKVVPNPYDSLVDNAISPTIFVVFHDSAAYPEYLITFC